MQARQLARLGTASGRAALLRGLTRRRSDRVLGGVAAGLAARLHLEPLHVRAAFVVLALAGGIGMALYFLGWALLPEAREEEPPTVSSDPRRALGFGLLVLATMMLCREVGLWTSDPLAWPVALFVTGSAVLGTQVPESRMPRWARRVGRNPVGTVLEGQITPLRLVAGVGLIGLGASAVLAGNVTLSSLGSVLLAVAVSAVGLATVLGPVGVRLVRQVNRERAERVRSEERADMAAHLHDSVLQTLALIQRAGSAAEMATLARVQERELRGWLFGPLREPDAAERVEAALTELATRVEQRHRVPVEVVVVGDAPLTEVSHVVVQACGEAMHNAAQHSGAARVSVYVEVEEDGVSAFVTDEGAGFDLDAIPADRAGIAESIVGRITRAGGTVEIDGSTDEGTEVRMHVPAPTRVTDPDEHAGSAT